MERPSLVHMAAGYMHAKTLYVTVELGIAEALAAGPRACADIAKETGTDPGALRKLLRSLVGLGLATQLDTETYELTEEGGQLCADRPDSMRDAVLLSAAPELWRAWGDLATIVRTGEPSRQPVTGWTPLEWLLQDPEGSVKMHRLGGDQTRALAPGIAEACDVARFGTVADIGGGDGTLIAGILTATPGLHGILYDLPTAVATAPPTLTAAGVADRCDVLGGDFFTSVPSGADAYVLKYIVHDWNDDQVITILGHCRAVIPDSGRLFIVETVMPPIMTAGHPWADDDLGVLVGCGGAERTEDEYRVLFAAAGFTLTSVSDVLVGGEPSGVHAIEATPIA
ncbi:methyltransferase [Kutzneria buriramensis]|uniref:Methyltransferase family protein n=1 Tax=Kutzneria buriramensis TaxID=1045776 RepID=A0A3E0HKD3_9PSEU|nr:methyltransferase [Kutzneria buriramensis]REH46919.1 methyltransferase family protein [Kutzneria buriramensis]